MIGILPEDKHASMYVKLNLSQEVPQYVNAFLSCQSHEFFVRPTPKLRRVSRMCQ